MFVISVRAFLGIVALTVSSISAADPMPVMSLREAMSYARAHQPSLAAARSRIALARAQADIPRAMFAPKVTAAAELLVGTSNNTTASYATLGALDVARIGGSPANAPASWSPRPSTFAGVAVHQELFDFGRIAAQADAYDSLARAATENERSAQLDVELLVRDSFYAVQAARAILAASDAAVQRARAHRDLADARVKAQLWKPVLLTRAEADLAKYAVDRTRAAGALTTAQDVLAATIGSPIPAIDAGDDDVAWAAPPPGAHGMRELEQQAPEVRAARAALRFQQRMSAAIRRELAPDISLSAELTGRAGGDAVAAYPSPTGGGWLPAVPNWDALVVVSWPLVDRVVSARARASERAEAVRAAEIDEAEQAIRATVQRADVELEVAREAVPALQRALDAARANHAQSEAQFTAGLGTAIELADAEALLTDAQIQLALGQFQQARARARLGRALAEATP